MPIVPTGVGQPLVTRRRVLAFISDADITENRRRKKAERDAEAERTAVESSTGSSGGNGLIAASSSGSSSSGIRSRLLPSAHPTVIDEAMSTEGGGEVGEIAVDTATSGEAASSSCAEANQFHVNEPSLTQLVEEAMGEESDDEDLF